MSISRGTVGAADSAELLGRINFDSGVPHAGICRMLRRVCQIVACVLAAAGIAAKYAALDQIIDVALRRWNRHLG